MCTLTSATFESVPFKKRKPLLSEVSKIHFIEKGGTLETEDSLKLGPIGNLQVL